MECFKRSDGKVLDVLPSFRKSAKTYRAGVTPRKEWRDQDYLIAARTKLRRFHRLVEEIERVRGSLEGADVLEVGCGDGMHCLLLGLHCPVKSVRGIDLFLPVLDGAEKGAQTRALIQWITKEAGLNFDIEMLSTNAKIHLEVMDARAMTHGDGRFDVLVSRSAMEHIVPIQAALAEMIRVVRPGGLIHHSVDPFYWLRGCHKRGLTDMPWAHARLGDGDFERFVAAHESPEKAAKRLSRIKTLNRYTLREWRELLESGPVEVLEYREEPDPWSESMLKQHPEITESVLPGVEERDLVTGRINVWLRRR